MINQNWKFNKELTMEKIIDVLNSKNHPVYVNIKGGDEKDTVIIPPRGKMKGIKVTSSELDTIQSNKKLRVNFK
jgi:hypothetical protein